MIYRIPFDYLNRRKEVSYSRGMYVCNESYSGSWSKTRMTKSYSHSKFYY